MILLGLIIFAIIVIIAIALFETVFIDFPEQEEIKERVWEEIWNGYDE